MIYGIDIGGTKIELVAFDADLAVVDRRRVATPTQDYERFLDTIVALVEEADARFRMQPPVGLGIPGLVDRMGRSFCANVPGAMGRQIAPDLASRLGRPISAENDCRCFALSEARGGAGAGHRIVFGAILGTGAGGGLVLDGRLERGRQGIAGEYGHLPLPAGLQQAYGLPRRMCGCGLPGCVEAYVAGPGLVALGRHFGIDAPEPAALVAAWRAGEPAAVRTRDCLLDILGSTFASMVKLYDPDIFVLGGGLSLIDEIVEMLPAAIGSHLFPGFPPPPVARARFGDSSGVRGAAILAQNGSRA